MEERDASPRVREEEEPGRDEQGRGQGMVEMGDQGVGLVGKVDRFVDRVAGTMEHTGSEDPGEGRGVSPTAPATPETGEGDTLRMTADTARTMRAGDELAVRLPDEHGREGWTYEVEGDESAVDISERAVLSREGEERTAPGASGGSQFLVRASQPGEAVVRFERLDTAGGQQPLHLRVTVEG